MHINISPIIMYCLGQSYMTLHAGLRYSIIVQSFSLIPLTVFLVMLVKTEKDNDNYTR